MAANRVAELRRKKLMSRLDLAQAAGLSEPTVARVEAGRRCRLSTQRRILAALGLPLREAAEVFPDESECGSA